MEIQFIFVKSGNPPAITRYYYCCRAGLCETMPWWNMQKSVRAPTSRMYSLRNYIYVQRNRLKFFMKKSQTFKLKMWNARTTQHLKASYAENIQASISYKYSIRISVIKMYMKRISMIITSISMIITSIKAFKYINWRNHKLRWFLSTA